MKNSTKILSLGLLFSSSLFANWELDTKQSEVSYLSTKIFKGSTASATEKNVFKAVTGTVSKNGTAKLNIQLSSVETNIPIRNERMIKHVFQTDKFPSATIEAKLPEALLKQGQHRAEIEGLLSLHGKSAKIKIPMTIDVNAEGKIVATSTSPILLSAQTFAFNDGLKKLTELAGLEFITTTVPVSFVLSFNKQ
ncbi:YceI family protein [Pleionea sp. CnH1-48]|uniref:YceI family protein n=1 Tax=Pleionea sp. CnH1-48 TaxID=2954494 RepID=UPI002097BD25|nr:YceI family protein [Pleionea sp. CnH1-48]MCO7223436.1 YceI family protein [Pleionea sp. CnH1-48]